MNNQLTYLLIFLIVSLSCQNESVDRQIDGCVGATFYYLDNQSSRSLSVAFVGPVLNQQLDSAMVIASGQRVLIGQDASFGSSPHPADTFTSFGLYTLVAGQRNVIYRQNPVQTALWLKRKHNPAEADHGCQKVDYTLTITNELLQ
ncbi:hypothetical protein GCM10028807_52720 [Spirosoma daeguense]